MEIAFFVLLNALGHLCFVGARMTTTLFALRLGASEFTVGLLMALFAILPMMLSVSAGRFIDRVGPRRPLLVAFAVLAGGVGRRRQSERTGSRCSTRSASAMSPCTNEKRGSCCKSARFSGLPA